MEENKNIEIKKVTDYVGFKISVSVIAIILAIIIALVSGIATFSSIVNNASEAKANKIMTSVLLKIMPEKISSPDGVYEFYREKNNDFDPKTDDLSEVVLFYYIDSDDNKVYVEDGVYESENGESLGVAAGFMFQTLSDAKGILANLKTAAVISIIIILAMIIWMSYYIWLVKEEKRELLNSKPDNTKLKRK